MKCFRNVIFFGRLKPFCCAQSQMFQKRDVQNMKCFRIMTCKIWNVSDTWRSKHMNFECESLFANTYTPSEGRVLLLVFLYARAIFNSTPLIHYSKLLYQFHLFPTIIYYIFNSNSFMRHSNFSTLHHLSFFYATDSFFLCI